MRVSKLHEKIRIIYRTSEIFSKTMSKTKMKSLVDAVFETEGIWIDKFEYVIYLKIKGDLTGYLQGTDEEIKTKVGFLLDSRNYVLYSLN